MGIDFYLSGMSVSDRHGSGLPCSAFWAARFQLE
jgi:hypothetical protein